MGVVWGMKTRYIIGAIILCMGISLYLRIAPPYDSVFTGEWVKFIGNDAYWQMANVDKLAPNFLHYTPISGPFRFFHFLLSGTIWVIGLGSPTQHTIDTVAAYFPAVLGALTVIPVYFLGKAVCGRMAGIIAATLIAILPGEWLGRSSLGFTDHHVLEVLLTTTALLFVVLAVKGKKCAVIV